MVCKIFEILSRFSCGSYLKRFPDFQTIYSWNIVQNSYGLYLKHCPDFQTIYSWNIVQIFTIYGWNIVHIFRPFIVETLSRFSDHLWSKHCPEFVWFIFETLSRFSCGLYSKHCSDFHMVYIWNIIQILVWFVRYLNHCEKLSRFAFMYRKIRVRNCWQTVERIFRRTTPSSSFREVCGGSESNWSCGTVRCVRQYPACSRGTEPMSLVVPTVQQFLLN